MKETLNDRLQKKAKALSDSLFLRRKTLLKPVEEPLKGMQLSPTEKKKQYQELVVSKELLINALAGAAIVGSDGQLRIRTDMVDAMIELKGK